MWNILSIFLIARLLIAEDLEVLLPTAAPPPNLSVLYAQRTSPTSSDIWIWEASGAKQLTFDEGYSVSPVAFPNSGHFLYVSFKEGQSKIYRACIEGPQRSQLFIALRGSQILPAISPQGGHLAFITDIAGRPDLFVQSLNAERNPIGKPRQLFSAPRSTTASPTFSPDGTQIAFVSDKDGAPRIYLLNIASSNRPRLLTKRCRENTAPAWSPDGMKLAYSAKTEEVRQIWMYDFAADEEIQLTQGPEMKENPSWALDSLHLVYNTESDESCELHLLNTQTCKSVQISSGPGQKRFPCVRNTP